MFEKHTYIKSYDRRKRVKCTHVICNCKTAIYSIKILQYEFLYKTHKKSFPRSCNNRTYYTIISHSYTHQYSTRQQNIKRLRLRDLYTAIVDRESDLWFKTRQNSPLLRLTKDSLTNCKHAFTGKIYFSSKLVNILAALVLHYDVCCKVGFGLSLGFKK